MNTLYSLCEKQIRVSFTDSNCNKRTGIFRYVYPYILKEYFTPISNIIYNAINQEPQFRLISSYETNLSSESLAIAKRNLASLPKRQIIELIYTFDSIDNCEDLLQYAPTFTFPIEFYTEANADLSNYALPPLLYKYALPEDLFNGMVNTEAFSHLLRFQNILTQGEYDEELYASLNDYKRNSDVQCLIIDDIEGINTSALILEHKTYKEIPGTIYTYRIDKGNTNTHTKEHIHVFCKNKQLFAINIDGTPHDGSKYKLSKALMKFLTSLGFIVPENGILEWWTLEEGELLLD